MLGSSYRPVRYIPGQSSQKKDGPEILKEREKNLNQYNELLSEYKSYSFDKTKIILKANEDSFSKFEDFLSQIKKCNIWGFIIKTKIPGEEIIDIESQKSRKPCPGSEVLSQINAWIMGELKIPIMIRSFCHIKSIHFNVEYGITFEDKKIIYMTYKSQNFKQVFFISGT